MHIGTMQTTFPPVQAAPNVGQQQAQTSAQQMHTPPSGHSGDAVDSTAGSDVTFRPVGAGGSSSGLNGGGTPPPFPSFNAGSQNQQRSGQAFTVQVKPKDPPIFRGRVEDDVTTWTAKVQDFYYLTDASDVQQVAYAATLLQDAASDWWHSLLKTRGGMRPRNFRGIRRPFRSAIWEQHARGSSSRGAQEHSGKDSLRQSAPTLPASRRCWVSYPAGNRTGRNPSSFGDCMDVWPSWSPFHPRRICMLQFAKRSRWRWRVPSPTWVAPINSHEEVLDGGAGAEAHADGSQPSKWTNSPWPMLLRVLPVGPTATV